MNRHIMQRLLIGCMVIISLSFTLFAPLEWLIRTAMAFIAIIIGFTAWIESEEGTDKD